MPHPARTGQGLAIDPASGVFRRIASGGHADLLTLEPAIEEKTGARKTEISVATARGVDGFLGLTAGEGRWRVVIVDTADELNRNAANAILKLLEEPPARVVLLLLSASPPAACWQPSARAGRRLALRPLTTGQLDGFLTTRLPDLSPEERITLARLARGSSGQALDLAARGGLELDGRLNALLESLPQPDLALVHSFGDQLARKRAEPDFRTVGELLGDWLARRARAAAARGELEQSLAVWEKVSRLFDEAERYSLDRKQVLLTAFSALQRAERA